MNSGRAGFLFSQVLWMVLIMIRRHAPFFMLLLMVVVVGGVWGWRGHARYRVGDVFVHMGGHVEGRGENW